MWQHVQLSEQIRSPDTLACCWDVSQPTNHPTRLYYFCRYRRAVLWDDNTVNYYSSLFRDRGDLCAHIGHDVGSMYFTKCDAKPASGKGRSGSVCQTAATGGLHSSQSQTPFAGQQAGPRLFKVNVTTTARGEGQWCPVTCPSGHVTHIFLACDVFTLCWAGHDVTFSARPEFWALPTSQSCPTQPFVTSPPPSFLCGSEEQRVPYTLVCDHRRDCLDGSDETFCVSHPCQWPAQFECLNKQVRLVVWPSVSLFFFNVLRSVLYFTISSWNSDSPSFCHVRSVCLCLFLFFCSFPCSCMLLECHFIVMSRSLFVAVYHAFRVLLCWV